ncbi:unnamed protein product [Musa hybrid cultivar]
MHPRCLVTISSFPRYPRFFTWRRTEYPIRREEEEGEKKDYVRRQRRRDGRTEKGKGMVFNAGWVAAVARVSAEACQYVACNPERLSSEEVLDLLFCLPLRHLRGFALCLFSFLCFPPFLSDDLRRNRLYYLGSSSSSSSSSDEYDSTGGGYDSHSD